MHHAETIVARRPFVCYFAAVVGAAVVHHNHLQMGIRLAGNALQALLQIRAHIIHRHNHRNQRLFHTEKFCLTQIQQIQQIQQNLLLCRFVENMYRDLYFSIYLIL